MNPQQAGQSGRRQRWLVAGLGACLVGCLAVTATLIWLACTAFQEALEKSIPVLLKQGLEQKLDQTMVCLVFLGNLNPDDIEGAYDLTTDQFRRRQSAEEFAELIGCHPELQSGWVDMVSEDAITYRITTKTDGERMTTFKLRLRKEADKWQVDEIVLP